MDSYSTTLPAANPRNLRNVWMKRNQAALAGIDNKTVLRQMVPKHLLRFLSTLLGLGEVVPSSA